MTSRRQWLLNIAIPGFLTLGSAAVAVVAVAINWQTALSVLVSLAIFPLLLLLMWWITLRPRLFIYNVLIVHWSLWVVVAAVIGLLWWLHIYLVRGSVTIFGWDAVLIACGLLISAIVLAWRFPQMWNALMLTKVPEEQISMTLRYLGKLADEVGRGSPFPDDYLDGTFSLEITRSSPSLQKTIVQILLNRVDTRGIPKPQQWIANYARVLWPLGVFDTTSAVRLNPVGASCQIAVCNRLSLTLYASDWADTGSDWFSPGQRYLVTVYFSDRTWAEGMTIIPQSCS